MIGVLAFLIMAQQANASSLPLADRCALVSTVLNSRARKGIQGGERPSVINVGFPEVDHVRRRTSASGRIVVSAEWRISSKYQAIVATNEACRDGTFVLENEQAVTDRGATPLIVLIRIDRMPGQGAERFRFDIRLAVSRHKPRPSGGGAYAVPPMKFLGVVNRVDGRGWLAQVTKAAFAS